MPTPTIQCAIATLLVLCFTLAPATGWNQSQAPASAEDVARMAAMLQEAEDLQATQLSEVPSRLAPLLEELRGLQQAGTLTRETAKIYQEALLLQISTQTKMLAPEDQIAVSFRELLLVNPVVDETAFNPRERLLMDKVRSAETGHLSLKTDPPGASLRYAGTELGITPLEISLIAGTYPLRITKDGYLDQEFTVAIQPSEIFLTERTLRRRAVELPLSTNAPGISITMNGGEIGKTQPFETWITSLPADRRETMRSLAAQWGGDMASAGFFLIPEVDVDTPISLELKAPCYQPFQSAFTIREAEVDWNNPMIVRPELRHIELKRDTGFMEVTSVPSDSEVWIDGVLVGKTPLQQDICVGTHSIQVLHSSGQYRREIVVQRDQISKVAGEVRPALLFLGMYAQNTDGILRPDPKEWDTVARQLILRGTAFVNLQILPAGVEDLRKSGGLPLESLLAIGAGGSDSDLMIRKLAADNGHVDLLLFGVRTGGKTLFYLFNTIHRLPDRIEVSRLDDSALAFLVSQLNQSENVGSRLSLPDAGIEVFDTPYGLTVATVASGQTDIAAGSIVRAVNQKPLSFAEFQGFLRSVKPGQQITLDLVSASGETSRAILPIASAPAEYPWSLSDGIPNAILTMLHSLVERDPLSDLSKFASLSLARGLMEAGEWKLALEYLARTNLEPRKSGICPGTVLYYQGRCYEAMSDTQNALRYYTRARDYPNATLGTKNGISVAVLADGRIQSLKRQPQ